jgi:hypothetical protein
MAMLEGMHTQGPGGRTVRYRAEFEVVGNAVHFKASFSGAATLSTHEGQFDFDPSKIDAAAAVDAFMQNHIEKADFDIAP